METRWPVSISLLESLKIVSPVTVYEKARILTLPKSSDFLFRYDKEFLVEEAQLIFSVKDCMVDTRDGVFFPVAPPFFGLRPIERQTAIDPFHLSDSTMPKLRDVILPGNWICLPNRTLSHFLFDDLYRFVTLVEYLNQNNIDYGILYHPSSENYVLEIVRELQTSLSIPAIECPSARAETAYFLGVAHMEVYPEKARTKKVTQFLEHLFPVNKNRSAPPKKRIFVNRAGFHRRIPSEDLFSVILEDLGFITISTNCLTWRERIEIFSNAEVVIGVHGAGLSGIIFCKPGTSVIELYPSSMSTNNFFFQLTHNLEMPFSRVEIKDFEESSKVLKLKLGEMLGN